MVRAAPQNPSCCLSGSRSAKNRRAAVSVDHGDRRSAHVVGLLGEPAEDEGQTDGAKVLGCHPSDRDLRPLACLGLATHHDERVGEPGVERVVAGQSR